MTTAQLKFSLVGKTNSCERISSAEFVMQRTNKNRLDFVKDIVHFHFGERPIAVVNETKLLTDSSVYPAYFSAGWFVRAGDPTTEIVIVEHGSSMKDANRYMRDSLKLFNWDELASPINKT